MQLPIIQGTIPQNDVYLLYICSESAILVGDWDTEGQCRSFIENKFGRVIAWRILAAKRSFADRLNYFNDVYNNLYLHYGDCVHFMSADILEIYINSICDKFSKKASSEYLASFLNIYPPLIADETARRHFVEIIEHKQNEIYR